MFFPLVYCVFFASTIFARFNAYSGLYPLEDNSTLRGRSEDEGSPLDNVLDKRNVWELYIDIGKNLWVDWQEDKGEQSQTIPKPSFTARFDLTTRVTKDLDWERDPNEDSDDTDCNDSGESSDSDNGSSDDDLLEMTATLVTQKVKFRGAVNVEDGLFVVQYPTNQLDLLNGPDSGSLGWWMWYTAHERANEISDLRGLAEFRVNGVDGDVIDEYMEPAIAGQDPGTYEFTAEQGGAFWALLGCFSEGAFSIMHMLTDHKQEMGGLVVVQIKVYYGEDGSYVVKAVLGHTGFRTTRPAP